MHELAITQSVVDMVVERMAGRRVGVVRIRVGELSGGNLRLELCTENGQAIPGFGLADMHELIGDESSREVRWKEPLDRIAGRVVRRRMRLVDADLYSFRFFRSRP